MKLDFSALSGEPLALLMQGLVVTLHLAAWSLLGALAIGLTFGILRWMSLRAIEPVCWLYVEFARNTPPVVQLLFWYFSASFLLPEGVFRQIRDIGYEFTAAAVALAIYHGAFVAEVVRAGLNAIPKGQIEAARALGLGFMQSLRAIILPQAARITAPPLVNETVSLIKNTSLAMAIGVTEMTYQYKHIDIFFFRGVEALAVVTVVYLVLCLAIAGLGKLLETSLSRHVHARRDVRPALTSE